MATRSTIFEPEREPLRDNHDLQLNPGKTRGPFTSFNPTQAHFRHVKLPGKAYRDSKETANVEFKWTSRNNRKGRHALVVSPSDHALYTTPAPTNNVRSILRGIGRMITYYPIWDVSYLVAFVFTWGSVIWVINSFLLLLPYLDSGSVSADGVYYGGGITAFVGATVFEIGSFLLMLEAINENRAGCFGWALEEAYQAHSSDHGHVARLVPDKKRCTHHHANTKNLLSNPSQAARPGSSSSPADAKSWLWWPSNHDLRTHYLHDLGFIACLTQTVGATIFYISGFTGLPGIYNQLTTTAKLDGTYWIPQILGGIGFVISGLLFMLETQPRWWQPAPRVLGWHIGLWNLIGGIGFTLCPIFGLYPHHWGQYQASVSTFWGESVLSLPPPYLHLSISPSSWLMPKRCRR